MARAKRRYAALGDFLDGYLHQDFRSEHRDALGAARAYARAASETERKRVAADLRRWLTNSRGKLASEWRADLGSIGGAWQAPSLAAIEMLLGIIAPESAGP